MTIQLDPRDVSERAYALWERRGRPDGDPQADWFEAETQLRRELDDVRMPAPGPEQPSRTMELAGTAADRSASRTPQGTAARRQSPRRSDLQ